MVDRGRERRRHAARQDPAPRAGDDAQGPGRRRRRLRRAEGAAAAAVACGAAGRLRFRPRRLLRRRRRGRLDARPDQAPCRRPADASLRQRFSRGDRPRPQPPRRAGRRNHRRRRGRDRRRHGDGQARLPLQRRQGPHPRGRHLPHHHDLRRADDAGRRHLLRRHAPPARAVADAGPELSDQEMGGRRRDGGLAPLRRRHRLARRHRAGADHDADRARRGHHGPAGADHAQPRFRGRSPSSPSSPRRSSASASSSPSPRWRRWSR